MWVLLKLLAYQLGPHGLIISVVDQPSQGLFKFWPAKYNSVFNMFRVVVGWNSTEFLKVSILLVFVATVLMLFATYSAVSEWFCPLLWMSPPFLVVLWKPPPAMSTRLFWPISQRPPCSLSETGKTCRRVPGYAGLVESLCSKPGVFQSPSTCWWL